MADIVQHPSRYEIREGRDSLGVPRWHVRDPQRNSVQRISVFFPSRAKAERCREVLLRDDERRFAEDR